MIWLSIIKNFLFRFWKEIAIVIIAISAYYAIYNKGYEAAYRDRTVHYEEKILKQQTQLIEKLNEIEEVANFEATTNVINHDRVTADLNKILGTVKNKSLYIVKNGECVPSETFLDSYNSIIRRGNLK